MTNINPESILTRLETLSSEQRDLLTARMQKFGLDGVEAKRRLVAYLSGPICSVDDDSALRDYARQYLPDYMVPQELVLLEMLPRTAVGKIDRAALSTLRPNLSQHPQSGQDAPRNEREAILAVIWSKVLGVDDPGVHDDFYELGGDSLLSIRILARARQQGLQIPPEQFFAHPTIAGQASAAILATSGDAMQGAVSGGVELTPIQHWFFERIPVDQHHWGQSVLLSLPDGIDYKTVRDALQRVITHHDQLRAGFEQDGDVWRQFVTEPAREPPLVFTDLKRVPFEQLAEHFSTGATRISEDMELAKGALLNAMYFATAAGIGDKLLLVAHHLIVDAFSWKILIEDLSLACSQMIRGENVKLSSKTTAFKDWAKALVARAAELEPLEIDWWGRENYWIDFQVPLDKPLSNQQNLLGSSGYLELALDPETTRTIVEQVPKIFHSQINDALLTALGTAISRWSGKESIQMDLEGHGREALEADIDVSRTVGWFTTVYPVRIDVDLAIDVVDRFKKVKEQLRAIPGRGLGYGLLRNLSPHKALGDRLVSIPMSQICFNYLGRVHNDEGLLHLEAENIGTLRSPRGIRAYLVDVDVRYESGQLQSHWTFNKLAHRRETIERLAESFNAVLRELAARSEQPGSGGFTPSDFPLANLGQEDLDGLAQMLDELDDE